MKCWRCLGRGFLGYLQGGAPLICRLCHGSGYLERPVRSTRWSRLKAAWHRFVKRHIVAMNPWEP